LPINADDARGDGRAVKFEGATCVDAHGLDASQFGDFRDVLEAGFTQTAARMAQQILLSAVPGLKHFEARRKAHLLMNEALSLMAFHTPHLLLPGATPPLPPTPPAQSTVQCGWSGAVRVECARADAFVA
jgi:hypothetical protein